MYIRCPKCGRRGQVPDRWVPEVHSLRCRKCQALFKTPELARIAAEVGVSPSFEPMANLGRAEEPGSFMADGYFGGFDDDAMEPPRTPGPGDSNYELTFAIREVDGESGSGWDTETPDVEPEAPSSDEIPALTTGSAERWHHRFIESFGLVLIVLALALIAIAVPTIGYLLWQTLGSVPPPAFPSPTLIAGLACAVGLLMISVPLILISAFLSDLVRDSRRRDQPSDRGSLPGRNGRSPDGAAS
jgi:hypothetical protein